MNILITGGTGLIGKALVKKLRENQHNVRVLTRKKTDQTDEFYWNPEKEFIDDKAFENLDSIIHLAGANISGRWTEDYKKELFSSRIGTADLLRSYCKKHAVSLKSFISASGINFYGTFTSDQILDENSGVVHDDFLADLCEKWENAADEFSPLAERIVCLRTAMVLAKEDGAFPKLKKTVDFNLGAPVSSGKQWMNWIHLDDLVNMYVFAVENERMEGKFNAVADEVPNNEMFMKTLAEVSGKPFLPLNVPAFVMKLAFGEMSSIILEGTRATNKKIKSLGFDYTYSELRKAVENLV
ncbi:TIGR01777 family oxidoreductase [Chryseobacterium sp.]|uniref:TIGR01777 family oxidoreductase n=1 Tax=Chryseobacterium sp. TaxID=1871047 RepID=UPI00162922BB|nr:TIGR01777 family oxidoreductase [Chryseobacterium sp.]